MGNGRQGKRGNRNARGGDRPVNRDGNGQAPASEPPRGDGDKDSGGDKGQSDPPGTRAENTIALFTAALFFAAVVQAVVSYGQWKVSQNALWDAQTPNIRLWFDGGGIRASGRVEPIMGRVLNSGTASLFNGKVYLRIAYVPNDRPMAVWNHVGYSDDIVMGPGDREDFPIVGWALSPDQMDRIMNGEGALMVAMRVDFPDAGNRMHHRYVCDRWHLSNSGQPIAALCPTPPQN